MLDTSRNEVTVTTVEPLVKNKLELSVADAKMAPEEKFRLIETFCGSKCRQTIFELCLEVERA